MNEGTLLGAIDVTAPLFWVLRLAAGIGGAVVGWFITGPVVRLMYRGAFHRPTPRWLLPWTKLAGAGLVGFLVFYYLMLGGFGGLGWGPGAGGGPGLGAGDGSGKTAGDKTEGDKAAGTDKPGVAKTLKKDLETLEIEVIGGLRYKKDDRFYLLKRQEPVVALDAVDEYLKKNKERLEEYVTIILTPDSVDAAHSAVLRLKTIIEEKHKRKSLVKDVDRVPEK